MQHRDPTGPERPSRLSSSFSRGRGALSVALFLQLYLWAILVPAYSPDGATLAYLFVLYAVFAAFLHESAVFAWRAGRIFGLAASLGTALCITAQLRLDAEELSSSVVFVLVTLLAGALHAAVFARGAPPHLVHAGVLERRLLVRPYGALVLLLATVVLGSQMREGWRWNLLHHQRLFGHPLYYWSGLSIPGERDRLWSLRPRLQEPWENAGRAVEHRPVEAEGLPHVIFLMVDTLRADALAHYGGEREWMPVTNELAERSVVFRNMRSNASWTRASCASIFTGLLPEEHGAARFHERLSPRWTTMPELLQGAGYRTAAFVTNWVQVGRSTGFAQGFDHFFELNDAEEVMSRGQEEIRDLYARAETVNEEVLDWLAGDEARRAVRGGKPLFLYIHYLDPHAPYLAGLEPGNDGDPRERKRGLYRQELRYFDRELGVFLERLDALLPGPRAIVLSSDHGEEFWEHGQWGHGHSLYKELTWVPALVHLDLGDEHGATGVSEDALESRDLYDLVARLAHPEPLDGMAWARERARKGRYASQYLDRAADVRPDKKWTGLRLYEEDDREIIWSAYGPSLELYDLAEDPLEQRNRIDELAELREHLLGGMDGAVRFWSRSPRVSRSAEDLRFLRALGYAGGVDETPELEH